MNDNYDFKLLVFFWLFLFAAVCFVCFLIYDYNVKLQTNYYKCNRCKEMAIEDELLRKLIASSASTYIPGLDDDQANT